MIEDRYDIPYIAAHALREKQVQQNYRPIIAVHKWFARRPGTLFRALMLAEFGDRPVAEAFTASNQFYGLQIADPFMGGGSPLIEANRLGADVVGLDINPMAYWIVRQEIEHLDLEHYRTAADNLVQALNSEIGHLYTTRCRCGHEVPAKYFLWVKQHDCPECSNAFDLWPGYLIAKDTRHPAYVIVCHACGALNERPKSESLGQCDCCAAALRLDGNARRNRATCSHCGKESRYPNPTKPPRHRLYAIEYYCAACRPNHQGRFFKKPDRDDLAKVVEAEDWIARMRGRYIPEDAIPAGDETNRLHKWGYLRYRDMFSARQLIGLELAARRIAKVADQRVRNALATNLSDLLRYQNLLCRYDTMALKSLDIFSVHGFPVSLVQCESNMLGITSGTGVNVGSGGWSNIIEKFYKAKVYCDRPFETLREGSRKTVVHTEGEWIGDRVNGSVIRKIDIRAADAARVSLPPESLDAVFTDPPYFGMVQYAELMDFCYVWLRKLVGGDLPAFRPISTRHDNELTGNQTNGRGLDHFAEGLSRVYQRMADALKPGRPLAFTFHHNHLSAYGAIAVAILDSGLACTAALPCPAEMGGSIHIANTGSSILDTVFVCRKAMPHPPASHKPAEDIAQALHWDIEQLAEAGYRVTLGDIRCLLNGHICRSTVNKLAPTWSVAVGIHARLSAFTETAGAIADPLEIIERLNVSAPRKIVEPTTLFDEAALEVTA